MFMYFNKESGENGEGEKDPLIQQLIGCAIEVPRALGPGLLESTYEKYLSHELKLAGLPFINQTPISLPLSVLAALFVKLFFQRENRSVDLPILRSCKFSSPD